MSLLLAMALAKELEVDGWAEEGEFLCHGEARHSFFLFLCNVPPMLSPYPFPSFRFTPLLETSVPIISHNFSLLLIVSIAVEECCFQIKIIRLCCLSTAHHENKELSSTSNTIGVKL